MSPSLSATNPLPIVSAVGFESDVSQAQREASCNYVQRMIVSDLDLDVLAKARLDKLEGLKLDKCSGFSTDGLLSIVKPCRFPALCKKGRGMEIMYKRRGGWTGVGFDVNGGN
ncbi:hypothetical protein Bca101_037134 [Brassica carinata]